MIAQLCRRAHALWAELVFGGCVRRRVRRAFGPRVPGASVSSETDWPNWNLNSSSGTRTNGSMEGIDRHRNPTVFGIDRYLR
ncbi:hypothetical protein chiPu_0018893 [Chiloscyllium punctatum]|uniref:Uncharacterized protein n=1 Tax=Chiloscyllium punctatum TaxID=137246 RepID=A0A401RQB9_CHIPU|nr:hypothetical protein [Chiloscyllium punctatum]